MARHRIVKGPGYETLAASLGLTKRHRKHVILTFVGDDGSIHKESYSVVLISRIDLEQSFRVIFQSLRSEFFSAVYNPYKREGTIRGLENYEVDAIRRLSGLLYVR